MLVKDFREECYEKRVKLCMPVSGKRKDVVIRPKGRAVEASLAGSTGSGNKYPKQLVVEAVGTVATLTSTGESSLAAPEME